MKHRVIVLAGAALLLPAAGWCAEGGEAAGGGSWLSLIFYVINFVLFLGVLAYYIGPRVRKFFADRAKTIRAMLTRAETGCKEAQDLADRAAARMASLEEDKARLRANLDAETVYLADRIRELGRDGAARIRREAELTAAALSEAAHRQVRELLAGATARLARDIAARSFTADDQTRMLEVFEQKLRQEAGQ